MSHHFDTPTAREDPRINVCDFYLFGGSPGTTVMAMTVNPDAGVSAPETFRDEGLYAFRFDLNGDAREELAFKVRFGAVEHAAGDEPHHVQPFQVLRSTGPHALKGVEGELVASSLTGASLTGEDGIKVFAGLAPDLFAGDAQALGRFRTALAKEKRFAAEAWENRKNFFARRNVTAIVLEVPTQMIGSEGSRVHAWATASLFGHAPEVQVSRWGLPLITNVLLPDEALREIYNRTGPDEDRRSLGRPSHSTRQSSVIWLARPRILLSMGAKSPIASALSCCLISSDRTRVSTSPASTAETWRTTSWTSSSPLLAISLWLTE